jgi:hypothetical protein
MPNSLTALTEHRDGFNRHAARGPVVDRQRQVERHGAHDRPANLAPAHNRQRLEHEHTAEAHLHLARTPVKALLQRQHQHIEAAQAGAVTKQHQHARAHRQPSPANRQATRDAAGRE